MRTNTQRFLALRASLAAVLLVFLFGQMAVAQGTAFTYQGKLTDAGNPANGNYDLQFKLFDTPTVGSGAQQGTTLVRNPVMVSAGVFSVQLDFGASVFTGATRYLEIGVRSAGSGSAYTLLAPRQTITSTPYAIQTLNAQQLGGLPASGFIQNTTTPQAGANFNIGGNGLVGGSVGIGTTTPETKLTIRTPTSDYGLTHTDGTIKLTSYVGGNFNSGYFGTRSNHPLHFFTNDSGPRLTIAPSGNVGIGLTNPGAKLQVSAGNTTGVHVASAANAIIGLSTTPSFAAIYGENTTSGSFGVFGKAGSNGTGVQGEGSPGVAGTSTTGIGVFGRTTAFKDAVYGESPNGTGVRGVGANGVAGITTSNTGNGVYGQAIGGTPSAAGYFNGDVAITGTLVIYQSLSVTGDKNFVEPHPTDPNKMIAYVALEGPEAGTYFRGSGRIVGGVATIQVPEDFRLVTDEKGITVQVTPMGEPATIWLVKKSLDQIELKGSADVEFDFLVNGVRRLSKDHKPIVENTIFLPRWAEENPFKRIENPALLRRLKDTGILNEDGSVNMKTVEKLDAYRRWKQTPQKEQP